MSDIYTKRLYLRPFEKSDEAWFIDLKTHPENMAQTRVGALDIGQAIELLETYIAQWQRSSVGMWALFDRQSDHFIGECGFAGRPGFDGVTLRYTLDRLWWGRGLAPESVSATLEYGRRHPELKQVFALAMAGNTRSCRILEQAGMTHVEDNFDGVTGFRRYVLSLNG